MTTDRERERERQARERRQREQRRREQQLSRNWTRRGFVPAESYFLMSRGFDMQRARTGSNMHAFIFATIERRRRLIQRLKDLGLTEKDIFNYLTEMVENRFEGTQELLSQFSDQQGFLTRADRIAYINEEARKPAAIHLEIASSADWTQDREQRLNYINSWVPARIAGLPSEDRDRELGSTFPDFNR